LRWYGDRLAARVGFTIAVWGEEPESRLAAPVENTLFRIAQEALMNVAKHAQASQVTVTVEADNGTVRLVIADDGIGFEPGSSAKRFGQQGWGVLTMTERAEGVGGHCRIESQPGQGTRVIVEVAR
jgi:signal transduction histidine kinase